jgi:sarcosine oxidase
MSSYDVIVVGLGAMGSAAVYHLARRERRVLGIEQFSPGHDRGSSHGRTRIIRLGYFEHPSYVPLLRRSYELWRELESAAGRRLLTTTGILEIGRPDGALVASTLEASRLHAITHDLLSAADVMRKYPAFRLSGDFVGVRQPDGGVLAAEPAIHAHLRLAGEGGAEIRIGAKVRAIEPQGDRVRVVLEDGAVEAAFVILAAGPWLAKLLPELSLPLRVTRQVITWFAPSEPAVFAPDRFPVFILENPHGLHFGFPADETGVKLGKHHHRQEEVDPDGYGRHVSDEDIALIRPVFEYLPRADGPVVTATTCLYTMTPDGHFIIDRHPAAPNIMIASPCSGHGFKFAPLVGEILADLAIDGTTSHDISMFRLDRVRKRQTA